MHVLTRQFRLRLLRRITGITGTRSATAEHLAAAIPRVRKATDLPVAVGFGVRTPAQAAEVVRVADAAVVASALIDTLAAHLDDAGPGNAGCGAHGARPGARAGGRGAERAGHTHNARAAMPWATRRRYSTDGLPLDAMRTANAIAFSLSCIRSAMACRTSSSLTPASLSS